MNVQIVQRRNSVSSMVTFKTEETPRSPAGVVRVQPLEYVSREVAQPSPDLVPYIVRPSKPKRHKRPKSGCCSKVVSNFAMMKSAFPYPSACSSPAEVLLTSFMQIIKKEQFWAEELSCEIEEQQRLLTENKPVEQEADKNKITGDLFSQTEAEEEQDKENLYAVKEISEVEERRLKLISADKTEKLKILVQCIALTRIAYGDHSFDHAEALVNLAQAYLDWKLYHKQAAHHCKAAKTILKALSDNEAVQANEAVYTLIRITFCRLYLVEAKALIGLKMLKEAEKMLEKAKGLFDTIKTLSSISEAQITWFELRMASAFVSLYVAQQRFGQAASSLSTMVDIELKKLSSLVAPVKLDATNAPIKTPSTPVRVSPAYFHVAKRIVEHYQQLGVVEQMRGESADFKVAANWFKKANEIVKTALGMDVAIVDPIIAPMSAPTPPASVASTVAPKPTAATAEQLVNQQQQIQDVGKVDDLKESLKLRCVSGYLQISRCQSATGQLDMAEGSIKKALSLFEDSDHHLYIKTGKKNRLYHIVRDELAKIYVKSKRNDDAITLLVDALPSKRTQFGDFAPRVMETYNLLVSLYLVTVDVEKAVHFLKKYKTVAVIRFGATDSRVKNADATLNMLVSGQQDKNGDKKPLTFKINN